MQVVPTDCVSVQLANGRVIQQAEGSVAALTSTIEVICIFLASTEVAVVAVRPVLDLEQASKL